MDTYKETFETWNKVAALYQEKFMDLDIYNETYDFFCNAVTKENASILEIGCGPGNITKYILSKRPNYSIEGIDISPNMVELAKNNNPSASYCVMDCRNLNELDKSYDGIICGFCLPYISDVECKKIFRDSFHLLKEKGVLYISFVEGEPEKSGFQVGSSGDRAFFYYHTLEDTNQLLVDNGFENPYLQHVNFKKADNSIERHTILITIKKLIT